MRQLKYCERRGWGKKGIELKRGEEDRGDRQFLGSNCFFPPHLSFTLSLFACFLARLDGRDYKPTFQQSNLFSWMNESGLKIVQKIRYELMSMQSIRWCLCKKIPLRDDVYANDLKCKSSELKENDVQQDFCLINTAGLLSSLKSLTFVKAKHS